MLRTWRRSKGCKIPEDDARRFIRNAIAYYIFFEPRKGVVAHSAVSKLLAQDDMVNEWVGFVCSEVWPSACQTVPAMQKWPGSEEPEHSGVALNDPAGRGVWSILREDPQRARRFAEAMRMLQQRPGHDAKYLFSMLNWNEETTPGLLVDMGGSKGSIAMALLRNYPGLKCCVQDLPEVIQGTIKNADAYLLRMTLHDWSDKYAIQMLRQLVPALKHGAKVFVNEVVMPDVNALPFYHNQFLRGYDLSMKQQCNSKERNVEEWVELFARAEPRFQLNKVAIEPGSILSVVEFIWTSKGAEAV
ncbi:S-adenosyl-L-methionine-dependent methyltransferase [Lophiotrema nucula]|uniref:S-adenosyl-L-methionine-dependent methyltransferase n=1 Tax=Lophiotrema nucula TaxID=690887 RepID=A0A6A5YZG8_9PLEO|nr:S-adenosyl-L-methionine-dependent methyltransferase [Lophiotrema nucula]